jgi:pimeloyl-ACP methyl ester carboxylesterase
MKSPLLLLHGFPGSARMFRHVVPALSQVADVIAPDLPGFGESDVLPEVLVLRLRSGHLGPVGPTRHRAALPLPA